MNGTIVTRTTKAGEKRYHCVWRAAGKQRWKTFRRRRDADQHLADVVKQSQEGTYTHVRPLPMDEVFNKWLANSLDVRLKKGAMKPSTAKSYRSMVETHLRPHFAGYRSSALSAEVVNSWEKNAADAIAGGTMAPKTFNNLLTLLAVILGWARGKGQRYLAHDPLAEVERVRHPRQEAEFLEPGELTQLLAAAEGQDAMLLYLAAYSGLRRGELFGLKWADIDMDAAQLRVRRSVYQGAVGTPKTRASSRTVDIPGRLVQMLKEYARTFPPVVKAGEDEGAGYVFRTAAGSLLDPDNWYKRHFLGIVKRAGLRPVGLHTLRHTYASLLINGGEGIRYVQAQMGHASIQMTADVYGHLFKETSVSAMNRLAMRIPVPAARATGTEG